MKGELPSGSLSATPGDVPLHVVQMEEEKGEPIEIDPDFLPPFLLNQTEELPHFLKIWLTMSRVMWWYVVIVSGVSLLLYALTCGRLLVNSAPLKRGKILLAVSLSDAAMLLINGSVTILQEYLPHSQLLGSVLCRVSAFAMNVSNFFTNWCWLFLWGERYLAVQFPMWHLRTRTRYTRLLLILLLFVLIAECWSLIVITEREEGGVTSCQRDNRTLSEDAVKWLTLAEALLSYALPFLMITVADLSLFCRIYVTKPTLVQMGREDQQAIPDSVAFLPKEYQKNQMRKRKGAMRRTILSATLDIVLNLPLYVLHLLDNFVPIDSLFLDFLTKSYVESAAYILFYLQYPLIVVYVRFLAEDLRAGERRTNSQQHVTRILRGSSDRSEIRDRSGRPSIVVNASPRCSGRARHDDCAAGNSNNAAGPKSAYLTVPTEVSLPLDEMPVLQRRIYRV